MRVVVVALDGQEEVPRGSTFHAHVGSLIFDLWIFVQAPRGISSVWPRSVEEAEDGEEQDQTLLYLCRNQYSLWRESLHFGGKSKQRFTSSNLWMVCGV